MLLFRKFVRLQAPQVAQRKVAGAVQVRVLAAAAALTQEQRTSESPPVAGGKQRRGIYGAILINGGKVAVFPPLYLIAEADICQPPPFISFDKPGLVLPHTGGGYAVAHQIAGGEIFRAAP